MRTPKETNEVFLGNTTNPEVINEVVDPGAIYISHFMFMEDAFATVGTFRVASAGTYHSDPKAAEFTF